MSKKDKNNQNINSIPKYLLGNYFKKPIKWLAHLINDYGNSKHPFITTGTSYAYAIGDEKRRHPELTELQVRENIDLRIKQNRKKLGLPTENTPSLAAAGLALGSLYYPWLAIPDIIFDTAASIDEPSTSNNLHTIADFPETVAKFTPSKIDDYIAKGVLTLGNIDDAVSTSGRNMFSIFDKKTGKINNTIDKTSVRESTNIRYRKNGGQIRKMQTAAGGPLVNESTRVEKPIIITPKKINKTQLSDDNLWEKTDNSKANVYPNLRNDKYIQEFFLYDYAPRFKKLNNFASQDYVNAALNIYKNTPISIYNEDNNVGGYKTGGRRETYNNYFSNLVNLSYEPLSIYLNEKFKLNRPTLVHELTHAFRLGHLGITGDARFSSTKHPIYSKINKEIGNEYYGSGYSNSEKNILNNTYNMKGYKISYDPLWEKGTTNTEVRFRLWRQLYDKLGRRPSLEETDKYIRTYDGEKLLEMIRDANAYGHTMYDNGMLINLIKNALINVAQNNSNNTYLLDDQTYYAKQGGILEFLKNGSGIHIKEKNKGKFTKYCHGKVTDECILKGKSSPNPAIRKRATFADNARHFKHRSGGKIDFLSLGGIFNNISSFMLSPSGQAIMSGVQSIGGIIGGISLSGKISDYRDLDNQRIKEGRNAIINDLGEGIDEEVNSLISQMKEQNPDLNFGEIDYQMLRLRIELQRRLKNMQKADMYEQYELEKQGKVISSMEELNSSSMAGSVGNLISSIGGIAGNFLNKKPTTTTSSTTQNLLNSNTIGKSTNPYMHTGLGANYNASTFFK